MLIMVCFSASTFNCLEKLNLQAYIYCVTIKINRFNIYIFIEVRLNVSAYDARGTRPTLFVLRQPRVLGYSFWKVLSHFLARVRDSQANMY